MKLTIIASDKAVYKDGVSHRDLPLTGIPENVHALQWFNTVGWIEYSDGKANEDIHDLPAWALDVLIPWEAANNPVIPPPTLEELAQVNVKALQTEIDRVAATVIRNSNGDSLIKYAGFANRYQAKATKFGQWVADVWYQAELYEAEVIAGTKPMPTPQEAVALMPPLPPIL